MNEYDVRRLAQVLAIQAKIEAMKIENFMRESICESPAYGFKHFADASTELSNLAHSHNDQL